MDQNSYCPTSEHLAASSVPRDIDNHWHMSCTIRRPKTTTTALIPIAENEVRHERFRTEANTTCAGRHSGRDCTCTRQWPTRAAALAAAANATAAAAAAATCAAAGA